MSTPSDNHQQTELLRQAVQHHQAGRHEEAEALYRRALDRCPQDAEAVHGLGFLRFHQNRHAEALTLIDRAIEFKPLEARYHHNHAEVLRAMGRLEEAIAGYRKAISLRPSYAIAFNNLGNALLGSRRYDEAIIALKQAIALAPNMPQAHNNLGLALQNKDRWQEAAAAFLEAVRLQPTYLKACASLAMLLHKLRRPEDAITCLTHALQIEPHNPSLLNNLGVMLMELKRFEEANRQFDAALAQWPAMPEANANLASLMRLVPSSSDERRAKGAVQAEQDRLNLIMERYERALKFDPRYPEALIGKGVGLYTLGRYEEAMRIFREVALSTPDMPDAPWNLGFLQLLHGDFVNGLKGYESRRRMPSIFSGSPSTRPEWEGGPLDGHTLLVISEQGLGDYIQMARYIPLLAARGARVILHARPPLLRLLSTLQGVSQVVAVEQPLPEHDLQVPVMSLPYRFGTTLETIPHEVPYFSVDRTQAPDCLQNDRSGRLKIGLAWSGSADNVNNAYRSIPLAMLASLARIPNLAFYSLQKGKGIEELADLPPDFPLVNLAPHLKDMADTAAAIDHLDLVISVDTAMAHLAGALAKPAWTLIFFPPEWRWLLNRSDSPWYPTMRLFRQMQRGDWGPVVDQLHAALAQWAAERPPARPDPAS